MQIGGYTWASRQWQSESTDSVARTDLHGLVNLNRPAPSHTRICMDWLIWIDRLRRTHRSAWIGWHAASSNRFLYINAVQERLWSDPPRVFSSRPLVQNVLRGRSSVEPLRLTENQPSADWTVAHACLTQPGPGYADRRVHLSITSMTIWIDRLRRTHRSAWIG